MARSGAKTVTFETALKQYREYLDSPNRSHNSYVEPALSVWEATSSRARCWRRSAALIEDVDCDAPKRGSRTPRQGSCRPEIILQLVHRAQPGRIEPVTRVKFFNEDNSRLRYLTEDEYNRLIPSSGIETSPLLAEKITLAVHTGLREAACSTCGGTT